MSKLNLPICWRKEKEFYECLYEEIREQLEELKTHNKIVARKFNLLSKVENKLVDKCFIVEQFIEADCIRVVYLEKDYGLGNAFKLKCVEHYENHDKEIFKMSLSFNFTESRCELIDWHVYKKNDKIGTNAIDILKRTCDFFKVKTIFGELKAVDLNDVNEPQLSATPCRIYLNKGVIPM